MPRQQLYPQFDASGGLQSTTSHLLRKANEVKASKNAVFSEVIGGITRRNGYEQTGRTIQDGEDGLYGGVYRYDRNHKIVVGINNAGDTAATLQYLDNADYWTTILSDAAPNTRFNCLNSLDDFYVAGVSDNEVYYPLTLVDRTMTTTRSYNVLNAPRCALIGEFAGRLYAINCEVDGTKHRDRAYLSSPPLGAITFIQTDQNGLLRQLRVDSVRYLKPGMQIDIYGAGTEAKKVSGMTIISVDKKNNRISFVATSVDVADNDEIWLTGRKGKLTRFWNTDYPTTENADFLAIPTSEDSETVPEFTAYGKNNGRFFLFTADSFYKWDGSNFTPVSETVGCISHETVKNIGKWTIWTHNTGVWGYNDDTGQLKLLSKAVEKYIKRINPSNYPKLSAGVIDRVYKLSIGELLPLDEPTTSTSTSSTSTSSTSSSTSSTSTSSTSTSSTSTSTTTAATTSTSTSSTTTSTSSTSTSSTTTSTSSSTSSTSTSTTTVDGGREVYRLIYDFDSNIWWAETHRRDMRFQFRHRMHGYKKLYFIDNTGRLFRDDTGNTDHYDSIPMEVEWGRDAFGYPLKKSYHSVMVDAERADGVQLLASLNGGNFDNVGQCSSTINEFTFKFNREAYDINYKLIHNNKGEAPIINSLNTWWSPVEAQGAAG